jgi:hypothetical protein
MTVKLAAWTLRSVLLLVLLMLRGIATAERWRSIKVLSVRTNCAAVRLSNHCC